MIIIIVIIIMKIIIESLLIEPHTSFSLSETPSSRHGGQGRGIALPTYYLRMTPDTDHTYVRRALGGLYLFIS